MIVKYVLFDGGSNKLANTKLYDSYQQAEKDAGEEYDIFPLSMDAYLPSNKKSISVHEVK